MSACGKWVKSGELVLERQQMCFWGTRELLININVLQKGRNGDGEQWECYGPQAETTWMSIAQDLTKHGNYWYYNNCTQQKGGFQSDHRMSTSKPLSKSEKLNTQGTTTDIAIMHKRAFAVYWHGQGPGWHWAFLLPHLTLSSCCPLEVPKQHFELLQA